MVKVLKWLLPLLAIGAAAFWSLKTRVAQSEQVVVAFQSAYGDWADKEEPGKGRDFAVIVTQFELYKLRCRAPNATLQRITVKPGSGFINQWLGNDQLKKWRVPLAARQPAVHEDIQYPKCFNHSAGLFEIAQAKNSAQKYIESL